MIHKILVIDDEESICEILQFNLEIEGYEVDTVCSAEKAMRLNLPEYSLVLLDVMMEGMNGYRFAQYLRRNGKTAALPIIFCTARDTEDDRLAGFSIGADDYISKPFSVREVVARVKSVLKRCYPSVGETVSDDLLTFRGLVLDRRRLKCLVEGEEILLTKKEMEILQLFLSDPGRIWSREEILSRVWKNEVVVTDRTIDVNITRLRKKIGAYGKMIVTRQGYGYGFDL